MATDMQNLPCASPQRTEEPLGSGSARNSSCSPPKVVEIFAGTANLSWHFARVGWVPIPVDRGASKFRPRIPVTRLDLSTPEGATELEKLLVATCPEFTHIAVPSGTFNRARERAMPTPRTVNPRPLRSAAEPWGLCGLDRQEEEQVAAANSLVKVALRAIRWCESAGKRWAMENPANSLFWNLDAVEALAQDPSVFVIDFHACMRGGARDNRIRFLSNASELQCLRADCDKSHEHQAWGKSDGGAYPNGLCELIVHSISRKPVVSVDVTPQQPPRHHRAAVGAQARKADCHVVREFRHIIVRKVPVARAKELLEHKKLVSDTFIGDQVFPQGARVWASTPRDGGASGRRQRLDHRLPASGGDDREDEGDLDDLVDRDGMVELNIGIYMGKAEFMRDAVNVVHPFDGAPSLPGYVDAAINNLLARPLLKTKLLMAQRLNRWEKRAAELEAKESELRASMDGQVKRVLQGKRLALLSEMIRASSHSDTSFCQEAARGFPVVGELRPSGAYPRKVVEADATVEQLLRSARSSQEDALRTARSAGSAEADATLLSLTREEESKGWVSGPLSRDELESIVGSLWIPVRRFLILQGDQHRLIDDQSEYGQNGTVTTVEKVDMRGVDDVAAVCKAWMGKLQSAGDHPMATEPLEGSEVDLKSAYKQLAIAPSHRSFCVLVLWNGERRHPELRISFALTFGGKPNVYHFNRGSKAIEVVANVLFDIPVLSYFDNYPVVAPRPIAAFLAAALAKVMSLLGWKVKPGGGLANQVFPSLGVVFDLSPAGNGRFLVGNKPERKEKLVTAIAAMLRSGAAKAAELASLHGKLRFVRAQCYPRVGAACLNTLARHMAPSPTAVRLSADLRGALEWWARFLAIEDPRVVRVPDGRPVLCIFTDGAVEDNAATVGAVIAESGAPLEAWGLAVPKVVAASWSANGNSMVIGQAEIAPVLIALRTWRDRLLQRRVVFFLDNDSARQAFVKGYSPIPSSAARLQAAGILEARAQCSLWFARVPTESNLADGPSRLRFGEVLALGGSVIEADIPDDWRCAG